MINFFFKTYGCQANVADSEELAQHLSMFGCNDVKREQDADLIIVNTCAVRDKAEQKLFSYLGELNSLKQDKQHLKIGVIGCVASYKKKEIYERFDQVNFVYGARDDKETLQSYLADLVVRLETTKQLYANDGAPTTSSHEGQDRDIKKLVQTKGLFKPSFLSSSLLRKKRESEKPFGKSQEVNRSFINIMTGCDKYCAYCIVPFTRGREVSYAADAIIERITHDIANGAKEVTLIGQNVNSYKDPASGSDFSELLRRVAKIEGTFWVRWISPHPQDMTEELFDVIAQHQERIPAYVHFPVQSGSNRVLELMKRNYTIERYVEQIGWLRNRMPHATVSTDIIVGFPGETEEDYQQTRLLMEQVKYDFVYSFIYSPRRYTKAWGMEDNYPKEVKTKQLEELQKRQIEICLEKNSQLIGKTIKTLVEKRFTNGKLLARSEGSLRVLFDGNDTLIGNFVDVHIESAGPALLNATLIDQQKADRPERGIFNTESNG